MTDNGRDRRGRFAAGNIHARAGGIRRAQVLSPERRREIARKGGKAAIRALADRYFGGDIQAARRWWVARNLYLQDSQYRAQGLGAFPDPGPLPPPAF